MLKLCPDRTLAGNFGVTMIRIVSVLVIALAACRAQPSKTIQIPGARSRLGAPAANDYRAHGYQVAYVEMGGPESVLADQPEIELASGTVFRADHGNSAALHGVATPVQPEATHLLAATLAVYTVLLE
jgi:hypothetical protein